MKTETFSTLLTLDKTNFEAHLRIAFNSKLPPLNSLIPPQPNAVNGQELDDSKNKKSKVNSTKNESIKSARSKNSTQWDLHIRNTFFPSHIFYIKVGKEQFKLITKDYGPQLKQKKLFSIVRQALDPDFKRASFGYFFADGDVDVQLGDDIVEKLRGKSRRVPMSTRDSLIIKIMFEGSNDASLSPISQPDLIFWLVLHQRRGTAPFDNYSLIRGLEKEINTVRSENTEMKYFINQFHSELARMRMEIKLLKDSNSTNNLYSPGIWSQKKSPSKSLKIPNYRTRLSHVVLTSLNQFESSALSVSTSMNGEIPYSQKVSLAISLSRGLLNCDVDFDLVVQFKESLLEQIETSETIENVKELAFTHLTDLLNPNKASSMNTSFNSSIDQDYLFLKKTKEIEEHLENIYKPTFEVSSFGNPINRPMILMLIGLKNTGKTTVALQLAAYYKKQGLRAAILETDTNSLTYLKIQSENEFIPFYGTDISYDCVEIAKIGIPCLLDYDIIIIDTPGFENVNTIFSCASTIMDVVYESSSNFLKNSKQKLDENANEPQDKMIDGSEEETNLSEEINLLPDGGYKVNEIIAVIDSSIGNEAGILISSYRGGMPLHTAIATNTSHQYTMGALTAISSTGTSIAFISNSDKMEDLEKYDINSAFSDLLDINTPDYYNSQTHFQNSINSSPNLKTSLEPDEIPFTLSQFKDVLQNDLNLINNEQGQIWMIILSTFTDQELREMYLSSMPRIDHLKEIAKRSECTVEDVKSLFENYLERLTNRLIVK